MIDFIKYNAPINLKDKLLKSDLLSFMDVVVVRDDEIVRSYQNAYYKGLEFKIYYPTEKNPNGRLTVEGSLHKYWNNGAHNFNDFNVLNIYEVVKDIKEKFNIKPEFCYLIQLEIGVNILPPIFTKTIVSGCMFYKTTPFKSIFTRDEGNYVQTKSQRFYCKIYDKKTHYANKGFVINSEIMRVERKYSKSSDLHKLGVYTLQDLLDYNLSNFKSVLLGMWNSVVYYDKTVLKKHPMRFKYNSLDYWESLTSRQRKYQLSKLNNLYKNNSKSIKTIVSNLIEQKVDFLSSELYQINPLYIELKQYNSNQQNIDQYKRVCLVTGVNISMQKNGSVLLSHTGLKYYFNTDKKVFNEVKRKYLTNKWLDSSFDIQIKEIAHNIRSTNYNIKVKQNRLYSESQITLFDLSSL